MAHLPRRAAAATLAAAVAIVLAPPPRAIPAFARKFQVNCYHCHTIFPRLNKMGYLFKRNGYRLPPPLEEDVPAPAVRELDAGIPWQPATAFALAGTASVARVESGPEGATTRRTEEKLDMALLLAAGTVPGTGFFYFGETLLYTPSGDHGPELNAATAGYVWGRADRSYFLKAGRMYLLQGEGFRASDPRGVMPWWPLVYASQDPFAFTLNQRSMGVGGGVTWSGDRYGQVLGLTAKLVAGTDVRGGVMDGPGGSGRGQFLFAADYLFGNDSGLSLLYALGRKEADVRRGSTFFRGEEALEERWGLFASHLVASQLDLSAAYLGGRARVDLRDGGEPRFRTAGWFAEASYYPEALRGLVLSGRWEGVRDRLDGQAGPTETRAWGVSVQKALLKFGDLSVRTGYRDLRREAPGRPATVDRQLRLDVRFAW